MKFPFRVSLTNEDLKLAANRADSCCYPLIIRFRGSDRDATSDRQ
jgi:hypothetical protein